MARRHVHTCMARRHVHTCMAYIRQKISTISSRSISPEASLSYIRKAHLRVSTLHCTLYSEPCTPYMEVVTISWVNLLYKSPLRVEFVPNSMSDVRCTLYAVHSYSTLHIVHSSLYTVHCTLHIVACALYTLHCTLCIVHCTLFTVHC